jgi:hypothetical protein
MFMMKIGRDRLTNTCKARGPNRLADSQERERRGNKINKFFRKSDYISFSDDRLN